MSRISKGKRQYLCKLYGVEDWLAYQAMAKKWVGWIQEAIKAKPIRGFTRVAPDRGYYSGCRKLSREVDCEVFYSVEKVPEHRQYLTYQRGRHRNGGTPVREYGAITATRTDDGSVLATAYDLAGNVLAYDIEADVLNVKCGQFGRQSSMPGVVYTDHAIDAALLANGIDQLKDLNIAETYPKTFEVFDEENFDRLIAGMSKPT